MLSSSSGTSRPTKMAMQILGTCVSTKGSNFIPFQVYNVAKMAVCYISPHTHTIYGNFSDPWIAIKSLCLNRKLKSLRKTSAFFQPSTQAAWQALARQCDSRPLCKLNWGMHASKVKRSVPQRTFILFWLLYLYCMSMNSIAMVCFH